MLSLETRRGQTASHRPWRVPAGGGRARLAFRALILCLGLLFLTAMGDQGAFAAQDPALADEPGADLRIQQLRVQVLPEFDDPRVLVVVQGRLETTGLAFPVPITFRVPKGAQVNQMAVIDVPGGGTRAQPFEVKSDPGDARWELVTYALDGAHFFYEFYYDPLVGNTDKELLFHFSTVQPVGDLLVEMQQPRAATRFALEPAPTDTRLDETRGFTYHQFEIGFLEGGGEAAVVARYTKTDPAPSVSRDQAMSLHAVGDGDEAPAAHTKPDWVREAALAWVLAVTGACAALAGISVLIRRRPVAHRVAPAPTMDMVRDLFCRMCGTALRESAQFCHFCGTPSRAPRQQGSH